MGATHEYAEIFALQEGVAFKNLILNPNAGHVGIGTTNPSPGLGWDSRERLSLRDRGPADLVLALALVHHLVFSCCVPLSLIAEWFGSLGNHLLVEFVPPSDPMVKKLLANRDEEHLPYDLDVFRSGFQRIFDFVGQTDLQNDRSLFLCRRRQKTK